jgi:hypothetical protein
MSSSRPGERPSGVAETVGRRVCSPMSGAGRKQGRISRAQCRVFSFSKNAFQMGFRTPKAFLEITESLFISSLCQISRAKRPKTVSHVGRERWMSRGPRP